MSMLYDIFVRRAELDAAVKEMDSLSLWVELSKERKTIAKLMMDTFDAVYITHGAVIHPLTNQLIAKAIKINRIECCEHDGKSLLFVSILGKPHETIFGIPIVKQDSVFTRIKKWVLGS